MVEEEEDEEDEEAAVAAAAEAPRRNSPPATPLSPSIFSMIFERARSTLYAYMFIRPCTFLVTRIHTHIRTRRYVAFLRNVHTRTGPIAPFRLGRRWLALLRRGCQRRKSGNGGNAGEGGRW